MPDICPSCGHCPTCNRRPTLDYWPQFPIPTPYPYPYPAPWEQPTGPFWYTTMTGTAPDTLTEPPPTPSAFEKGSR